MSKKYKFLHNFFKILEELNIDYWLEGGTALSAYRDGKIFEWEHDFDIGVLKEDILDKLDELIERLSNKKYKIIVQKKYPFIDNIIQIYTSDENINPNQIDIYIFTRKKNHIYMRWLNSPIGYFSNIINSIIYLLNKTIIKLNSKGKILKSFQLFFLKKIYKFFVTINYYFYKSRYHCFPINFFEKKRKIFFCELELNIPYKIESFLEYRYGINWKTPDKNFNQDGKWKSSKARPILPQNYLPFPKIDYDIHKLNKHVD